MYLNCLFCLFIFKATFRFSVSSLGNWLLLCFQDIYPFYLGYLICWWTIAQNILIFLFLNVNINSLTFICVFNKFSLAFFHVSLARNSQFWCLPTEVTFSLSILLSSFSALSFLIKEHHNVFPSSWFVLSRFFNM